MGGLHATSIAPPEEKSDEMFHGEPGGDSANVLNEVPLTPATELVNPTALIVATLTVYTVLASSVLITSDCDVVYRRLELPDPITLTAYSAAKHLY
jgi:hypothetical protein